MTYMATFTLTTELPLEVGHRDKILGRLQDLTGHKIRWCEQSNSMGHYAQNGTEYHWIDWGDCQKDMLTISKEFPDVHFILEGSEIGDFYDKWRMHVKNGKQVILQGEIMIPEFKGFE